MAIKKWFLPTNTENLGMILAQGLISDPEGFSKYYADILHEYSGYIPLLSDRKENYNQIAQALAIATSEDSTQTPCIIEININPISGKVFTDTDNTIDISSTDIEKSNVNMLFITAPLPLTCISRVLFSNTEDKNNFIKSIETIYRNVPLHIIKTAIAPNNLKKVYNNKSVDLIKNENNNKTALPDKKSVNYKKTYALGGLLCSLFYFSKNGSLSTVIFKQLSGLKKSNHNDIHDLPLINNYFHSSDCSPKEDNPTNKMFHDILGIIVNENTKDCNQKVIEFLQTDSLSPNSKFRDKANKLAEELLEFHRNTSEKPTTEIFKLSKTLKDKSSIKLILLMLFHRKDVEALINFDSKVLDEEDYLLFAMLFGMRDKFIKLPKFLKEYNDLLLFISNLMAQYAHDNANTKITFKVVKPPLTLIDMLKPTKLEFISWASKQLDIQNCFKTQMPNKEFRNSKGKSTYEGIVLPKVEIDTSEFFDKISKKFINDELYNKISNKYRKL